MRQIEINLSIFLDIPFSIYQVYVDLRIVKKYCNITLADLYILLCVLHRLERLVGKQIGACPVD